MPPLSLYRERAILVHYLSHQFSSYVAFDVREPYPVVYMDTPEGQLSWHIALGDMDLFQHLPHHARSDCWDGHTTEEKYERLMKLAAAS